MTVVWFGLLIVFLVLESNSLSLMSLWFAAGALVALILSVLNVPLWIQCAVFGVVSVGLLACLRPFLRKFIKPKIQKTNVDAIIGTQGYVIADIDNLTATGYVKLGGMEWSARSTSGDPICTGTLIQVDRVEGAKVFVTPVTK